MTTAGSNVNGEFFAQFLDDYFAECDEHLTIVRRVLLTVEAFEGQPRVDQTLLDKLFRSFHTIKGISGMVGVGEAERLAHHLESYLRILRQDQVSLSAEGMDALIAGTKMLEQVIAARRIENPPPDITPVTARLEALVSDAADSDGASAASDSAPLPTDPVLREEQRPLITDVVQDGARVWRFEFTPSSSLAGRGVNVNSTRARLKEIGEIIHASPLVSGQGGIAFEFIVASPLDESAFALWGDDGIVFAPYEALPTVEPAPSSVEAPTSEDDTGAPTLAPSNVVRVDLGRLDDLMRMIGELVVSRSRLDDNLKRVENSLPSAEWRALNENNLGIERQLRYLREGVMRVRMVAIGEIFERMHFVVRDLAREYKKKVTLELSGQRTEMDKFLVERMMDPILHLVRNAISHGLEPESERVASGKPPEGKITLRASTSGGMIVIEVEDDGRGIDSEQVASRARDMGLIARDAVLDTEELLELICAPSFSTREEADRASGRGVGMNVVRSTVLELGGTLALDTEIGRGTRFTIQLPLTLAVTDALIVGVGGYKYAVAQSSVREVIEIDPASVTTMQNNEIIQYRGGVLPVVRLARLFGLNERSGRALYALVSGSGSNAVAVAVDRLLGQREIVVRSFTDPLVKIWGIAGATELGDGRVILILDLPALTRTGRDTKITGYPLRP